MSNAKDISDTKNPEYDLKLRLAAMNESIKGFLDEFDLDLVVGSLIVSFRNKGETIKDNPDYRLLYLNLTQLLEENC